MSKARENRELFEKLAKCEKDSEEYTKIREEIITSNMRLVTYYCNKFNINYKHVYEDILSSGYIGLIKAVDKFNANAGVNFATFASRCIVNEILMYLRREKKHLLVESFETVIAGKDGDDLTIDDIIADERDCIEEYLDQEELNDKRSRLKECLIVLEPNELQAIKLHQVGLKQKMIGQKLDISQSYVSRILKKSVKKLQKEVASLDYQPKAGTTIEQKHIKTTAYDGGINLMSLISEKRSARDNTNKIYAQLKNIIYAKCNPYQKQIFDKIYFKDSMSVSDVATELGKSRQGIYNLVSSIIKEACDEYNRVNALTSKKARQILNSYTNAGQGEELIGTEVVRDSSMEKKDKIDQKTEPLESGEESILAELIKLIDIKCTPRQRQVVLAKYDGSYKTNQEVAAMLNTSESSVGQVLHSGLISLGKAYNESHGVNLSLGKIDKILSKGIVQTEENKSELNKRNLELRNKIFECMRIVCSKGEILIFEKLYIDGLTRKQIASELGIKENSLLVTISRTICKIQACLGEKGENLTAKDIRNILILKTEEEQE